MAASASASNNPSHILFLGSEKLQILGDAIRIETLPYQRRSSYQQARFENLDKYEFFSVFARPLFALFDPKFGDEVYHQNQIAIKKMIRELESDIGEITEKYIEIWTKVQIRNLEQELAEVKKLQTVCFSPQLKNCLDELKKLTESKDYWFLAGLESALPLKAWKRYGLAPNISIFGGSRETSSWKDNLLMEVCQEWQVHDSDVADVKKLLNPYLQGKSLISEPSVFVTLLEDDTINQLKEILSPSPPPSTLPADPKDDLGYKTRGKRRGIS